MKKKRNPQDATNRNVRAANKELKRLKAFVFLVNANVNWLLARVEKLEKKRGKK